MDATAQYDLAMMYLSGHYVKQDLNLAFTWLGSSADLGNANAQYNLALMYYKGDFTDQNVTKAAELLESAALQAHQGAIKNIGIVYMQLIKFDKALKWLKINAQSGDTNSYYLLAEVYCNQENFSEAKTFAKKSIESGNVYAKKLWDKYELSKY